MDKIRNAAIILLGLGEEYAEEILKNMSKSEVHKIMEVISTLDNIGEDEVVNAVNYFMEVSNNSGLDILARERVKNTLATTLGISGFENIDVQKSRWVDLIKNEPLSSISELLSQEHPQVIAAIIVILGQLGSGRANEIMKCQSKESRTNIIKRISSITPISAYAVEALSEFFDTKLSRKDRYGVVTIDGIDAAVNIISHLDSESEQDLLSELNTTDKDLADAIQDKLLPFDKLSTLDSRSLQTLLKEISNDDLVLSLKGSSEKVKNAFMKNMSQKAAEILKDDLESKGPVKLNDILDAQKRIILLARQMAKEDKILLNTNKDSNVVY